MPRTRISMNISFPSEEEKAKAVQIAKALNSNVSKLVQAYFRRLAKKK